MARDRYLGIDLVASLGDTIEVCDVLKLRQNPRSAMTSVAKCTSSGVTEFKLTHYPFFHFLPQRYGSMEGPQPREP